MYPVDLENNERSCEYLYTIIVLSMLYAEICPKVRRHNARPGRGVHYTF